MQVFNSFQEMEAGAGQSHLGVFNPEQAVENTGFSVTSGGTPPVDPAQKVGDRKPLPVWQKGIEDRVGALETQMGNVVTKLGNVEKGVAELLKR